VPRTVVGPMPCPSLLPTVETVRGQHPRQWQHSIGGWSGNEVNRRTPRGFARCRHDVFGTPRRLAAQHASAQDPRLSQYPAAVGNKVSQHVASGGPSSVSVAARQTA
jgi:hypothetical protein